jgi:D-alanine-D-alanine ligase
VRIGITCNLKSDILNSNPPDAAEEFDSPETIEAIRRALQSGGREIFLLGGDLGIIEKIKQRRIEFVFNIAEGFRGRNREAHIPAVLELLGIPYSGSDPLGLALTLDKALAKRIALSLSIPTPDFWVLDRVEDSTQVPSNFPLFVKPLWQGSSIGIQSSSKVENQSQLETEVKRLLGDYPGEPILIEKYVPGKEITAGVIGNDPPEILGLMEAASKHSREKDFIYSLEVKRDWENQVEYFVPPRIDSKVEHGIRNAALQLFRTLRLRDIARLDFRVTPDGQFYFIEANPLPGLSPESGDIVLLAEKYGIGHRGLILNILHTALSRYPALKNLSHSIR